jgi:hypothetical protein
VHANLNGEQSSRPIKYKHKGVKTKACGAHRHKIGGHLLTGKSQSSIQEKQCGKHMPKIGRNLITNKNITFGKLAG